MSKTNSCWGERAIEKEIVLLPLSHGMSFGHITSLRLLPIKAMVSLSPRQWIFSQSLSVSCKVPFPCATTNLQQQIVVKKNEMPSQ